MMGERYDLICKWYIVELEVSLVAPPQLVGEALGYYTFGRAGAGNA